MGIKVRFFILIIVLSIFPYDLFGLPGDIYLSVRSYYPTELPFNYSNLYLYYSFHYNLNDRVLFNFSVLKGAQQPGYYPPGYFRGSEGGIYERGSYYFYIKDFLGFKKIIIGNYVPLFGQGILFGNVFPLIMDNPFYDLSHYRDGVNTTGTTSKTILLEGIALEYAFRNLFIRPFFSWNGYDCTAGESSYYKYNDNDNDGITNDLDEDDFTGIREGFPSKFSCKNNIFSCIRDEPDYSDEGDREKRNNLTEYVAGINLSAHWDKLKLGTTVSYTLYNRLVDPYYNFDPDEGDKTGYYFRGKDYYSLNLYGKMYKPFELWGEIAGTLYKRRSYYPEFNGGYSATLGYALGIRTRIDRTGIILWGTYLPSKLVNTHSLELPEGHGNMLSVIIGMDYSMGKRRFYNWISAYRELYNEDNPDLTEAGFSYNYVFENPITERFIYKTDKKFEAIDNHYYAPGERTYKISSKTYLKYSLSKAIRLTLSMENRIGRSGKESLKRGTGFMGEFFYNKNDYKTSVQLMYYSTDEDRLAYLYPHESSLGSWRFLSQSLKGNGLMGSLLFLRDIDEYFNVGTKLKYVVDFRERARNGITLYIISELSF